MSSFWWVTPLLALVGALAGSALSPWLSARYAERRADRALVREARVAFERHRATRVAPDLQGYPGMSDQLIAEIREKTYREFFDNYFGETQKARAALGAIRHLAPETGEILDGADWRLRDEDATKIRGILERAEDEAWSRRWKPRRGKQRES